MLGAGNIDRFATIGSHKNLVPIIKEIGFEQLTVLLIVVSNQNSTNGQCITHGSTSFVANRKRTPDDCVSEVYRDSGRRRK